MRATLNELRSIINKDIDNVSDESILNALSQINDYGYEYAEQLRGLDETARKKWFSKFRTAFKYLPATVPAAIPLNKNNNEEQ